MTPERWRQVTEVFHAARSHDTATRAQYLDHACGGDRALRDEVDALLAAQSETGSFGESPVNVSTYRMRRLESGAMVGSYRIDRLIGAGGMGEVYHARDMKLGRDVAVKILSRAFTSDPDRLARFEREARILASLNHPHIGAIYGVEEAEGERALVLELVEGETLAERIQRGPLPAAEALAIARQIANALEAAHEKGIVHRDLKPANIAITRDDVVKVLDFGLAKAAIGDGSTPDLPQSPTLTDGGTQEGMIVGTVAYMSPEQARGEAIDKRTDIWALGCVFYEMLTGKRAFGGDNASDTIATVLKTHPDWSALPPDLAPAMRWLLHRTLEKDRRRRLRDIADVRWDIEEVASPRAASAMPPPRSSRWRGIGALALASGLTAVLAAAVIWWILRPMPRPVSRLTIAFSPDAPIGQLSNDPPVAISPDGSTVVYVAATSGGDRLMLRRIDQLQATPIVGAEGDVHSPFFSPDGQWIAFFSDSDRTLKKIRLAGGPPVTICKAPGAHLGASWGADGTIVFAGPGLNRVAATGGTPQGLTTPDPNHDELRHAFPEVLPNGKGVLFSTTVGDESRIEALRFDTGERHVVVENATVARYAPTGHLVYARGGRLFAAPFNQDQLGIIGAAVPVLEDVTTTPDGPAIFSFSQEGSLIYLPGAGAVQRALVWVDRQGREEPLPAQPRPHSWVRVSPDGTRLAMEVQEPDNTDVWIYDLARNTQTRLTFNPAVDHSPIWTPDGLRVVMVSGADLVSKSADGIGEADPVSSGLNAPVPYAWSRDGGTLVLDEGVPADIRLLPLDGAGTSHPLIQTEFTESRPAISPDGRWIAYQSNESGQPQIYVRSFPEINRGRWQVSTDRGVSPAWSRDGHELFYQARGGTTLMAVPVDTGQAFSSGTPKVLFEGPYLVAAGGSPGTTRRAYDVAPDGRFLMLKLAESPRQSLTSIVVVQNWFEELRARVPPMK